MESFLAGSISGAMSCCLFQPLDLIKTRIQTPAHQKIALGKTTLTEIITLRNTFAHSYNKAGMPQIAYKVVREESFFALWKGLTPSLYRTVPGVGMYFCMLHGMKSFMDTEPTLIQNLILGLSARSIVGTTMLPITVIKARYESGKYDYKNVTHGLRTVWRVEGMRGLFSGCAATIFRDAPYSGLYLMFYSQEKKAMNAMAGSDLGFKGHFICGIGAGLLASLATHPADVVKTQLQLYPTHYQNTRNCIQIIYLEYGGAGFLKGIVPRCLRRTLISAFSWTIFEEMMNKLKPKR